MTLTPAEAEDKSEKTANDEGKKTETNDGDKNDTNDQKANKKEIPPKEPAQPPPPIIKQPIAPAPSEKELTVRVQIIRHARTDSVGKSQSCMLQAEQVLPTIRKALSSYLMFSNELRPKLQATNPALTLQVRLHSTVIGNARSEKVGKPHSCMV